MAREANLIAYQQTYISHTLPSTLNINGIPIEFSKSLRNLGIIFDNTFSLHQHIMNTCTAAYIELRRFNSIRHFLSVDATKTLMCSLWLSKLDYCNSLLSGSPQYLIQLFQKVQNSAAWITLRAPRVEHTSPLLHWLPVQQRIKYKVCSVCYTTLTGASPKYMSELVNVYTPSRCLRSSSGSHTLTIPCVRTKTCGQRFFAYQGPAKWNYLPFDLRDKRCPVLFQRCFENSCFSPSDLHFNKYLGVACAWMLL